MNQKLLDQIAEIKQIAIDTRGDAPWDNDNLAEIKDICERIEIDFQIEKRLENDTRRESPVHLVSS